MADLEILLVPYYNSYAPSQVRPYCLNYTNSSGELASTRFIHDANGFNTKGLYQQITGQRSSVNTHEFDKGGRMVRKLRKYSDGETSEEIFLYDNAGKLASETFTDSKGISGSAEYSYDKDGNAERMLCNAYKGWLTGEVLFSFDKAGKRLSGIIHKDGKPYGSIEYKYEGGTNLVLEFWKLGDEWTQTLNYVYESVE
jgi:antitoxin component YwqK of YwqJK toxin-antitoxin module